MKRSLFGTRQSIIGCPESKKIKLEVRVLRCTRRLMTKYNWIRREGKMEGKETESRKKIYRLITDRGERDFTNGKSK